MSKTVRSVVISVAVVLVLFLLLSPKLRIFEAESKPSQAAGSVDMRLPVRAYEVRPETIDNRILATGTVLANEEVELRSEISGKIVRILFREGSSVKKGDLLVKIDDSELQAQLMKLKSQERLAMDIEQRRKELFTNKLISSEEYERALNELFSIRADIRLTEARIDKTELRAPFNGIVGVRFVSEGSFVSSVTRIASLQNVGEVKIDFSIPERYAMLVQKGHGINFRVTGSQETFQGEIFAIEPKIELTTRTVLLRAICHRAEGRILPGAFAEVELILERIPGALMIPTEAVVPDIQGQKVFVCVEGKVQERRVETGLRTETKIQVTSGLVERDTIITSGILQIRTGMPVRLTEVM